MTPISEFEVAPDPRFAEALERLLLADLGWVDATDTVRAEAEVEVEVPMAGVETRADGRGRGGPGGGRRTVGLALSAILAVAAVVAGAVLIGGRDGRAPVQPRTSVTSLPTTPTTTAPTSPPATSAPSVTRRISVAPRAPFGELEIGPYRVDNFIFPFEFVTTGPWSRNLGNRGAFTLERDSDIRVAVSTGIVAGETPGEVLANVCPGKLDPGPAVDAELFGRPALRVQTQPVDDCTVVLCTTVSVAGCRDVTPATSVLQLTAVDVGGAVVLVMARAPAGEWPSVADEIAALLASLTLLR